MDSVLQGGLSEGEIEAIVSALRDVDQESAWGRTLAIGRLIFENLAGSDERRWRSRSARKEVSLRKLVQHPSCPFKKSSLCSAVNVHLFLKSYPSVRELRGVSPTHVVETLALEPLRALELLSQASSAGWSARELGRQVRSLRKAEGERRGRPASPRQLKAMTLALRAVRALQTMQEHLVASVAIDTDLLPKIHHVLEQISDLVEHTYELPAMSSSPAVRRVVKSELESTRSKALSA